MKYGLYVFISLVILFFFFYFGIWSNQKEWKNNDQPPDRKNEIILKKQWETKIDEQLSVTVEITPIDLGVDSKMWRFMFVLDTHSGSLDQDPVRIVSLLDDKGGIYQPIAWEGSGPGGHHREGTLIFNVVKPMPTYFELIIKDVGGIPERVFRWNIE